MQTASAEAPIIGLDYEDQEIITRKADAAVLQCAVFVGDVLTSAQKRGAYTRLGGKLFPLSEFKTVPHGVINSCAITRLRQGMRGLHKNHVPEKEQELWLSEYTLKNEWNPATGRREDLVVGRSGASADLLFKPIDPEREIGKILTHNALENAAYNGVAILGPECGIERAEDIREAQFHYFPNWLEIVATDHDDALPKTLRSLEAHIENRRAQTGSPQMRAVGDAYVESVRRFFDWGVAYIDFQTAVREETKQVPGGARYDEIAERLFGYLELTRKDDLVKDFARTQNDTGSTNEMVAKTLALLAEHVTGAKIAVPEPPAPQTIDQAADEFEASLEAGFTDMSSTVIEPEGSEGAEKAEKVAKPRK